MPTVSRGLFRWLFQGGARLEDFADRLNHVWTFGLLLVLGAVISWKNSYSDPISCWAPQEFTNALVEYTHKTCWNLDTYFLPMEDDIPLPNSVNFRTKSYYQWVPFILCLQALFFKLPNVIMYVLHSFAGLDFNKIHGLTDGYQHLNLNERQDLANQIARYIYRWCNMFPRGLPWRLLTLFWFMIKVMFCINVIIQMSYLDRFLKTADVPHDKSTSYGYVIYDNLLNNATWTASPAFPRIILCDLSVRQLQSVQRFTLQCFLNNNPFTERVYMFLWVWILFVSVATTLSFVVWFLLTILPIPRQRYVRRFMELGDDSNEPVNIQDVSLVTGVLGEDGVMVLKLIAANSSELLVRDVICGIARLARRDGTTMTSGTIIYPGPSSQPLVEPTAPREMYPLLPKTE